MSVSSVRKAVAAAVADRKVTLAEAEKITHVAGRTSGISASEKAEIAKALSSGARFSSGAKAHLAANAKDPSTLTDLVNAKGIDVVSAGVGANSDTFSDEVKAGLEKFAQITRNQDGDSIGWGARELSVGGDKYLVVTDFDYDKDRELVGFLDSKGNEVARAAISIKDDGLTMNWEKLSGGRGAPIGTPSAAEPSKVDAQFKKALEKFADDKSGNGDDYGRRIEDNSKLPAPVRRYYEHMQRTIADGTAAEKFTFQGQTIYALRDFSCVSSAHFFNEAGQKLHTIVDG